MPRPPSRYADYIDWAVAQDLGPWRLHEHDGRWPVTVTYMRAPPGRMVRPRSPFHDLFVSLRTVELWEQSGPRPRRFIFRRGSVGFTPAQATWEISWTGALEGVGFLFEDEVLRRAWADAVGALSWRAAYADHAPALGFLGLEIANQVFAGFPDGPDHVDQLLESFFALAARRYGSAPERDAHKLGRHHPQVQRAIRFIEQNLGSGFSLEDVCRSADISAAHLNRSFRAEVGTSVWQYVKARRLERGHALLTTTPDTVAAIAAACGFNSTAHFCTSFRQRYGTPPMAVRSGA